MNTPTSLVIGIVFAPLGLVLLFTAAITPQWREGQARLGGANVGAGGARNAELLLLRSDGLWESCLQVAHSELRECWAVSGPYQDDPHVRSTRELVLASLFLCGTGILLACVGARCWTDTPLRNVAGVGGLLVALAGMLSLVAVAIYTHYLPDLGVELVSNMDDFRGLEAHRLPSLTLHPAGSLYFGWVGAWVQTVGGLALLYGVGRPKCPARPKQAHIGMVETPYEVSC
ncbi:claudin-23 [Trichomycterus rosablanca]|uniref:claudin-23 n=1 Tax=Trichomycterus rosablanca TaxID=2290929 RepID=UPI002F35D213